jgi:hypothetical protein
MAEGTLIEIVPTYEVSADLVGRAAAAVSIGLPQRAGLPDAGSVVEVGLLSYTSAGSTVIGVHKHRNTTPEETQTMTPPATEAASAVAFTSNHFEKGEVLSLSVDPTNSVTTVVGWVRYRPDA